MTEVLADPSGSQQDLFEEMHYAVRLAEERERSAAEEIDRLKQQFAAQLIELKDRVRSAEKNAGRAESCAAAAEDRVSNALQALRVLRCALTSHGRSKGPATAKAQAVENEGRLNK